MFGCFHLFILALLTASPCFTFLYPRKYARKFIGLYYLFVLYIFLFKFCIQIAIGMCNLFFLLFFVHSVSEVVLFKVLPLISYTFFRVESFCFEVSDTVFDLAIYFR